MNQASFILLVLTVGLVSIAVSLGFRLIDKRVNDRKAKRYIEARIADGTFSSQDQIIYGTRIRNWAIIALQPERVVVAYQKSVGIQSAESREVTLSEIRAIHFSDRHIEINTRDGTRLPQIRRVSVFECGPSPDLVSAVAEYCESRGIHFSEGQSYWSGRRRKWLIGSLLVAAACLVGALLFGLSVIRDLEL